MANNESSFTESIIMNNIEAELMPTTTRGTELSMAALMNCMKTMAEDIKHSINVKFDNTTKNFEIKLNELNAKLDERFKKQNEKWERDRRSLKENTEGELKQVSGSNGVNYNDDTGKCNKNKKF